MDGLKRIAQEIFCIEAFDIVHFRRKMALWRIVAENWLDKIPDVFTGCVYPLL